MSVWKDGTILKLPYIAVACNEKQWKAIIKSLGWPTDEVGWCADRAGTVSRAESDTNELALLVQINMAQTDENLLRTCVHESVHVWQAYKEYIHEREPSKEFEAYSVEGIFKIIYRAVSDERLKQA